MAIPNVQITVQDGGLGSVAASTDRLAIVFGPSSTGSVGYQGMFSSVDALIAQCGYGPGVSLAALCIQTSGQPVQFVKTAIDTAATTGSVTHTGSGPAAANVTVSGTPNDGYRVQLTIAKGGTAGTDVLRVSVSLDGGSTTIGTYAVDTSANLVIPTTGLTVTLAGVLFVAGDTYSFTTTQPLSAPASLPIAQVIPSLTTFPSMVFDASWTDAAGAGAISADMTALANGDIFARAVTSSDPSETPANVEADFATFSSLRVGVGAQAAEVYDQTVRAYMQRPAAWLVMARLVSTVAHIDAAQVNLGPLGNVLDVNYDARIDTGDLNAARFITLRSFVGLQGFYCTNPNLMSPAGSDYSLMQYGRVMDKICRVTRGYFLQALSSSVRLNPATGFILEKDAQSLEQGNDAALRATVIADGDVSSVRTIVSRVDNILSTQVLTVQVQAIPLGYLKTIDVTLSFINPAATA
jgi:hypothetical protein